MTDSYTVLLSGPQGDFSFLGLAVVLIVCVVSAVRITHHVGASKLKLADVDERSVESCTRYRYYLAAAVNAGHSAHAWDHQVRPVLAELARGSLANRIDLQTDIRCAGRRHLGEQLWSLVDPEAPRSQDRVGPGPSRAALTQILERLEAAD